MSFRVNIFCMIQLVVVLKSNWFCNLPTLKTNKHTHTQALSSMVFCFFRNLAVTVA